MSTHWNQTAENLLAEKVLHMHGVGDELTGVRRGPRKREAIEAILRDVRAANERARAQ